LEHKDNPQLLNQLAWGLATRDEVQERDLEVIDRIATRANDASNKKDPAVLDTLARVKFMKGEKEQAVQLQQKAVELADSEMKEDLQKTLTSYKEGKIPTSDGQ
jgi:Flp pilus assembly protein TadD